MKFTLVLLSAVASVMAQNSAAATSAAAAATAPSVTAAATAAGTASLASIATTADPSMASLESMASCITGAAYMSCTAGLDNTKACTVGDASAMVSCACSSASHAISCINICSISYPANEFAWVSSTCKSYGVSVANTGAGTGAAGATATAGSASKAGAMPTGMANGLVVAAAGVVGVVGAML